jgi:hypothetical protein
MNGTKTSTAGPGEWAQLAGANRFREAERVAAVQLDVLANQRRQSLEVVIVDGPVSVPDMADGPVQVPSVEEGDRIHHEPEGPTAEARG